MRLVRVVSDVHYIEIYVNPELTKKAKHDILGYCVHTAHLLHSEMGVAQQEHRIAAAFPDLESASVSDKENDGPLATPTLGDRIQWFGEAATLRAYLCHQNMLVIKSMVTTDEISISDIQGVPTGAEIVCYRGEKGVGKYSPSRLRRHLARAKARGVKVEDTKAIQTSLRGDQKLAKENSVVPFVRMHSRSNGSLFPIFVVRETGKEIGGTIDTYGLSTKSSAFGVPVV